MFSLISLPNTSFNQNSFDNSMRRASTANYSIIPQSIYVNGVAFAPVSLPNSCTFCVSDAIKTASNTTLEIPVQIHVPNRGYSFPEQTGIRKLGGNSFLEESEPSVETSLLQPQQLYYILPPAPQPTNKHGLGQKSFKRKVGIDRWCMKKCQERQKALSISRNKMKRAYKCLKRLQNHHTIRQWKLEQRILYEEKESIRQSKLEILRRKGLKAAPKTECPLWNCPRKEFRRKRLYMPVDSRVRSASRLSNLSAKSRSPIIFS